MPREDKAETPPLKPQVKLLGIASLLNDSASEMIYPLLPVFLTAVLGATAVDIGLIEGAADGLASILKYYAGAWSDRLPRRRPLIVSGYTLAALSRALIAAATVWPLVLIARLVDRTGKGIRSAPRDAMIADVTPLSQRGRAFGFHRALDHTGAVIGPLLALLFLDGFHLPLRTVFYIAVIPGLLGAAVLVAFLREEAREIPSAGAGEAASAPLGRSFWAALVAIAFFSLANSSDAFLLLQAHAAGVTTGMLPLLWAAHHVIKSLFSTRAGALSDRIDRRHLLIAGWLSYAIIYFMFPSAHSLVFFVVLFVLYAIPFTLSEGAERAWVIGFVAPGARGKAFGFYYLANGLCVLAGTILFASLYQHVSVQAAFYTGAALAVIAAGTVRIAPRTIEP
jgi:MFS family permease